MWAVHVAIKQQIVNMVDVVLSGYVVMYVSMYLLLYIPVISTTFSTMYDGFVSPVCWANCIWIFELHRLLYIGIVTIINEIKLLKTKTLIPMPLQTIKGIVFAHLQHVPRLQRSDGRTHEVTMWPQSVWQVCDQRWLHKHQDLSPV